MTSRLGPTRSELPPELAAFARPENDRGRLVGGAILYALGIVLGLVLNVLFFSLEIFGGRRPPEEMAEAMAFGAVPAFVMLLLYLPVPVVLDRFDPEPWWGVAMAFAWGALVATGAAGFINSSVHAALAATRGPAFASFVTTVYCAPVTEEVLKGTLLVGYLYFLKREFDGTVDGIIYAVFCALGFAAVENVSYYARAALEGRDVFKATFFLRGIVAPWGHPLYTAMTGIGVGIARESTRTWVKIVAPTVGLTAAILLHAIWNYVPHLGGDVFVVSLLFWFGFVGIFTVIVVVLVIRKGRTIREFLADEVAIGNLTQAEVLWMTGPFGRARTYLMPKGPLWRQLIRASARLALCKWHTARAVRGKKRTFSIEYIAPLRAEVKRIRQELRGP